MCGAVIVSMSFRECLNRSLESSHGDRTVIPATRRGDDHDNRDTPLSGTPLLVHRLRFAMTAMTVDRTGGTWLITLPYAGAWLAR
jgi:hypothetical protein